MPVLLIGAAASCFALACLYLLLGAVHDARAARRTAQLTAGKATIASLLGTGELVDEEHALDDLVGLQRRAAVPLLRALAVDLDGEALGRLRAAAEATGLDHSIRRLARSRRWRRRLAAAQLAHLLRHGDPARIALLRDRRALVRARVAEGLSPPDAQAHGALLVSLLADTDHGVVFSAQQALLRGGGGVVDPLADALGRARFRGLTRALEVAASLPDPALAAPLTRLAGHTDGAVRALAARGLGNVGVRGALTVIGGLLDDTEPAVRAAAASAAGTMRAIELATSLGRALSDRDWEVRYRAAAALGELGAPGLLVLRRHLDDPDRYARDVARQMLDIVSGRDGLAPARLRGRPHRAEAVA
jgi:HEAT repeat protein